MIDVLVNGIALDIPRQRMKYTKQVHDLADVSSANASYTTSFKAVLTPHTRRTLGLVGLVGSNSKVPYQITLADIHSNTIPIVKDGFLTIRKVNDNTADIFIQDGNIDFFKALDNKKFGFDIMLPKLSHTKDVYTVEDSFTNEHYRYLINDYGGETIAQFFSLLGVNIDYQAPSARVKYIWNSIFEALGFTYTGSAFELEDFTNAWITFPKSNSEVDSESKGGLVLTSIASGGNRRFEMIDGNLEFQRYPNIEWNINTLTTGELVNIPKRIQAFKATKEANYNIKISFSDTIILWVLRLFSSTFFKERDAILKVYKNNTIIGQMTSNDDDFSLILALVPGDVISLRITVDVPTNLPNNVKFVGAEDGQWGELKFDVFEIESEVTDFEKELQNLNPKGFIREVMLRFGLTPIPEGRNIHFMQWQEFLIDSIDWSSKFVGVRSEAYTLGNYGQRNRYKHLYNEEDQEYADGFINIDNQNLNEENIIITSKFYAPENYIKTYNLGASELSFKPTQIWEKEIAEKDGEIEINYKGRSGRFYWLKSENVNTMLRMWSLNLNQYKDVTSFTKAKTLDTTFADLIPKYSSDFADTLQDVNVVDIDLNLSELDVLNLDFKKIYYFDQLAGFYKLNKLVYDGTIVSKGEFIKIKNKDGGIN